MADEMTVFITKGDGTIEEVVVNQAAVCHGVDANGVYLGLVDPSAASTIVPSPPPEPTGWRWFGVWERRRNLAERKLLKWEEMKLRRSAQEYGTFTWDGSEFDADPESQSRIIGCVQLALIAAANLQNFSQVWTLADNSVRTLSGDEMINVGLALATHVGSAHARGRVVRAQIIAAANAQALDAIVW